MEIDKPVPTFHRFTGAQAAPTNIKPFKLGLPIKSDVIYLKACPRKLLSFALLDIIMKVWNVFSDAIIASKLGAKAYISHKTVLSIVLVVLKAQQVYKDLSQRTLLIIMILISALILICFAIRAFVKEEVPIGQLYEITLMDIYSIFIFHVFFIILLFDGIQSIAPTSISRDLLSRKSILTYLYELPEFLFCVLEISIIGIFIVAFAGEIIFLVLLLKLRTLWATTRDVTIHLYAYNTEIDDCMCVICYSVLSKEDYVCRLTCRCKATYHKYCIAGWYKQNECCPLCRKNSNIK